MNEKLKHAEIIHIAMQTLLAQRHVLKVQKQREMEENFRYFDKMKLILYTRA